MSLLESMLPFHGFRISPISDVSNKQYWLIYYTPILANPGVLRTCSTTTTNYNASGWKKPKLTFLFYLAVAACTTSRFFRMKMLLRMPLPANILLP